MTDDSELAFAGVAALAAKVKAKEVTPRELVELTLRRIDALDGQLNAFRVVMAEEALAAADALEVTEDLPLAGVPVAIKDDLPVAGQSLTWGSRTYGPRRVADSEAVRRLRAAGAIPVGVTNVPELMIFPWTHTAANGITRNPWDVSRSPGGSSGGSAAAVASGMVPAATASDGGGSIRIPASSCGLVGMKPTRGRVSTQPVPEAWLGLSVFGSVARSVADSALLLDAMAGAVAGDIDRVDAPDVPFFASASGADPGRLRIAVSRKLPTGIVAKLAPGQRAAWESTAEALRTLGHDVREQDPAYGMVALDFTATWTRGIYEDSLTVPDASLLEPLTKTMARIGRLTVPPWRLRRLRARRAAHTARILRLWDSCDVLLTPGLATTALKAEGGFGKPLPVAFNLAAAFTPWTAPFNLTGQPAITIPAGIDADGLPLSVQLVGRHGAEGTLYAVAAQLEAARPWADQRPLVS